ncbi:hypothetical protein CIB95_01635 [Lottiidibacillus patelloidae]|uniref:Lipoprotein n=1 Tax=Lottiidibacillus patelloidae TaxID=2670334 RepID=A0A263BX41_9BACI|nr:hypothetical protein [Lottiidibacillus patelloidae]OZM58299.1 hypothetical protein CIB95_01635 [Lottiidibacillus patelloidae]
MIIKMRFTLVLSVILILLTACGTDKVIDKDNNNETENEHSENNEDEDNQNTETENEDTDQEGSDEIIEPKKTTQFTLHWENHNGSFSVNGVKLGDSHKGVLEKLGNPQEIIENGDETLELYLIEDWFTRELAVTYKEEKVVRIELFGSLETTELEALIQDFQGGIYRYKYASYSHLFESPNGSLLVIDSSNYAKYGIQQRYIITTMNNWKNEENYLEDYMRTDNDAAIAVIVRSNPLYIHLLGSGELVVNGIKIGDSRETVEALLGVPFDAEEDKNYENQETSDHGYWPHWKYTYGIETEINYIEFIVEFYKDRVIAIELHDEMQVPIIPSSFVEEFEGTIYMEDSSSSFIFDAKENIFVIQAQLGNYRIAERADRNWINANFEESLEKVTKQEVLESPIIIK